MLLSVLFFLSSLYCTILYKDFKAILDKKGLFSYARHPIYSSISLFILSSCIFTKCFGSLGFYVYRLKTTFMQRIDEEERNIIEEHPNYVVYKRETPTGLLFI